MLVAKELSKRIKLSIKQICIRDGLGRKLSDIREDVSRLLSVDCTHGVARALCEQAVFKRLSKLKERSLVAARAIDVPVFARCWLFSVRLV